jgi:hypothetical protein
MILATVPGMVVLGRSGVRPVSRIRLMILFCRWRVSRREILSLVSCAAYTHPGTLIKAIQPHFAQLWPANLLDRFHFSGGPALEALSEEYGGMRQTARPSPASRSMSLFLAVLCGRLGIPKDARCSILYSLAEILLIGCFSPARWPSDRHWRIASRSEPLPCRAKRVNRNEAT